MEVLVKYSFGTVLAIFFLLPSLHYLFSGYHTFIIDLLTSLRKPNEAGKLLNDPLLLSLYKISKFLLVLLILLFAYWMYDFFRLNKTRLSQWTNVLLRKFANTVSRNIAYFTHLPRLNRLSLMAILISQCIFFLIFLLIIPFHYDEAWSYLYFSGKGLITTAIFYPLPNNHVFYNLIAGLFAKLPLDPDISTRLPSYFCSFVATYYFFKLSNDYFSGFTAIITTAIFASSYPFILYSIEARGYSFIICCTVLLFYTANRLTIATTQSRYRYLYIFTLVAGLYTMPSFIYAVLVITGILTLYFIGKQQWRRLQYLMTDTLKASLVAAILYTIIIYFNGITKLTNPNGAIRLKVADLTGSAIPHLSSTLQLLTGTNNASLAVLLLLIPGMLLFRRTSKQTGFLTVLSAAMLVSPIFILALNPIIPFTRTWVYLIVPLTLAIGHTIAVLVHYLKTLTTPGATLKYLTTTSLLALILLLSYANFRQKHAEDYAIDYNIRSTFAKLGHDITRIGSIGYTSHSMEYYVAEDLQFQCMKRDPGKDIKMDKDGSLTYAEDVLILTPDAAKGFQLQQYAFIATDRDNYALFLRKIAPAH